MSTIMPSHSFWLSLLQHSSAPPGLPLAVLALKMRSKHYFNMLHIATTDAHLCQVLAVVPVHSMVNHLLHNVNHEEAEEDEDFGQRQTSVLL